MSTTQQIIQLKRLALKTAQHLPHNNNWRWARVDLKQFNDPRTKQEILKGSNRTHWLATHYFEHEQLTIETLGELT